MREIKDDYYKRGWPDMNSCITGFIQYMLTKIIKHKLKKIKAPPNKKVLSLEELSSVDSRTSA